MKSWLLLLFLACGLHGLAANPLDSPCSCDGSGNDSSEVIPLFEQESMMELTYRANLKKLLKDKKDERSYHEVELMYVDESGDSVSIEALTRIRGNFRRKMCQFPPIRIKFDSATVVGTLFEGQNKLKLVTHCKNKAEQYEQYTVIEHLVYRSYNLITEKSFRVRPAKITYEDTGGKYDPIVKFGFFIESVDHVAARLGGVEIETKNIHPNRTEGETTDLLSIFEFMIGNTDWSIPGLHNVKIISVGNGKKLVPVPYDFDWCGTINAPYAFPNPQFGTKSVQDRVFRGFCKSEEEFEKAFAQFREHKEEIIALYQECELLSKKNKSNVLKYLGEFYEILEDPKRTKYAIYENCRTNH